MGHLSRVKEHLSAMAEAEASPKPMAMVIGPSILPEEQTEIFTIIQKSVFAALPVYYSFGSAANAINMVQRYDESQPGKLSK